MKRVYTGISSPHFAGGGGWCDSINPSSDGNLFGYPVQKPGQELQSLWSIFQPVHLSNSLVRIQWITL
jgi:hypothetical protein